MDSRTLKKNLQKLIQELETTLEKEEKEKEQKDDESSESEDEPKDKKKKEKPEGPTRPLNQTLTGEKKTKTKDSETEETEKDDVMYRDVRKMDRHLGRLSPPGESTKRNTEEEEDANIVVPLLRAVLTLAKKDKLKNEGKSRGNTEELPVKEDRGNTKELGVKDKGNTTELSSGKKLKEKDSRGNTEELKLSPSKDVKDFEEWVIQSNFNIRKERNNGEEAE
jgi:hypothetical protein